MNDIANDPDFQAWAQHVHAHVLPMISDSELTVSLVPKGETDMKFAVELGLSIMLDKPIIAVIQPGTKVSERLIRVADRIVEADLGDPAGMAKVQASIQAAMADLES